MTPLSSYKWKKTWTFWPRNCMISNDRIPMFATAYRGHKVIGAAGEIMLLVGWISPKAYMFEKLKGNI